MPSIAKFSGNSIRSAGMFLEKVGNLTASVNFSKINKMWWQRAPAWKNKAFNVSETCHKAYFIRDNFQKIILMNWGVDTDVTSDFTSSSIVLENIVDIIFGSEQNIVFILMKDGTVYGMGDIVELTFKTQKQTFVEKSIMKILFPNETSNITKPKKLTQISNIKKISGTDSLTFLFQTYGNKFYAIGDYLGYVTQIYDNVKTYRIQDSTGAYPTYPLPKKPILTSSDPTSSPYPLYSGYCLDFIEVFTTKPGVTDARIVDEKAHYIRKYILSYDRKEYILFNGSIQIKVSSTPTTTEYVFANEILRTNNFAYQASSLWANKSNYIGSFIKRSIGDNYFGLSLAGLQFDDSLTGLGAPVINYVTTKYQIGLIKIEQISGSWIFLYNNGTVFITGKFLKDSNGNISVYSGTAAPKHIQLKYANMTNVTDIVDIAVCNGALVLLRSDGYMYMIGRNGQSYPGNIVKFSFPFESNIKVSSDSNSYYEEFLVRLDNKLLN